MTAQRPRGVLQIGCGGFGQVHLQAWYALGLGDLLYVADPDPLARERAARFNLPPERIVADFRDALDAVEVVDVVASTALNAELCLAALAAGKDVFVEKPMTVTTGEALRVAEAERASGGRVVQVGYYFRHHPLARRARAWLEAGELGSLRYLSGTFAGFKRARRDIGVTQSDAVHFIDLFNWFTGSLPVEAFAVTRDHFGRGLEDLSLVLLTYPGGVVAKVESGLVQPGRRHDTVMPNAHTTKEVAVSGSEAAFAIDFQAERATLHRTRFERRDGMWMPRLGDAVTPPVEPAGPVAVVTSELRAFLGCVARRERPEANVESCGVAMARILDAVHESARTRRPVTLQAGQATGQGC